VGGPVNGKHPAAEQEPKDATGSDSETGTAGLIGMALDGRRTTGAESTLPKKLNQLFLEPGYIAFLNASLTIVVFQENVKKNNIFSPNDLSIFNFKCLKLRFL